MAFLRGSEDIGGSIPKQRKENHQYESGKRKPYHLNNGFLKIYYKNESLF
jgi:hypothetical protein